MLFRSPTSARTGKGKKDLGQALQKVANHPQTAKRVDYGPLEDKLLQLQTWLEKEGGTLEVPARWLTIKVLEKMNPP